MMKRIIKFSFGLFVLTFFLFCKKEPTENELLLVQRNLVFDTTKFRCSGAYSEYGFRGLMKDSICFPFDSREYDMYNGIYTVSIGGNSISTDTSKNKLLSLFLMLSVSPTNYVIKQGGVGYYGANYQRVEFLFPRSTDFKKNKQQFVEQDLKVDILPILDNQLKWNEGFCFRFVTLYDTDPLNTKGYPMFPGYSVIGYSTEYGEQSGSTIRCTQKDKKTTLDGKEYYDLTFEISCKLYVALTDDKKVFYGKVNGVFKTRLDL